MLKERLSWTLCGVAVGLAGIVAMVNAQAVRPVQGSSLDDLLTVVRELRVEVNRAANASVRMQVLVARVGLQEQRINSVAKQLADIRQQQPGIDPHLSSEVDRLEEVLRSTAGDSPDRKMVEQNLAAVKTIQQQQLRRQQQLRSQEAELDALLVSEQARWTEFNDRLDALERSLPPPSR